MGRRRKPKIKAAHHQGSYHTLSRRMTAAARADPTTTCWRDGLTLAQHPPHKDGTPPTWHCGHVEDMALYWQHPSPYATTIDGRLCSPEASVCNSPAGARKRNGALNTTTNPGSGYTWP